MASNSEIRIVFGSDQAATDIHDLPHPLGSSGFSFTDRQSEAWIEKGALNEDVLISLIKVFAIYGQAGCTSPRRVILLDGLRKMSWNLRDNLVQLWPKVIKQDPPMHVASSNILADQYARSLGWETRQRREIRLCWPTEPCRYHDLKHRWHCACMQPVVKKPWPRCRQTSRLSVTPWRSRMTQNGCNYLPEAEC